MFQVVRDCGALAKLLPEVDRLFGVPQPPEHHPEIDTGVHVMLVVDWAARQQYSLAVRFAALTHDLGKGETPAELWPRHIGHEAKSVELVRGLSERIRVPADCRDLAVAVAREHGIVHRALELRPGTVVELLERVDALRRPERFGEFLQACACDFHGRPGYENRPFPATDFLMQAFIDKVPLVFKIENIQIILLNSNLKTEDPFDFACGDIGKGQLKILKKILKENLPQDSVRIICLHHHPFIHSDPTMKLLDAEDFFRVIYGKTDILLFGHKHIQGQWLNKGGCKLVLASGALFEGLTAKEISIDVIGISVASVPIVGRRGGSKKMKMPQTEIDMEAIKEIKKRKKRSKQSVSKTV